jgi:DNA-3-methyladenine glycosylase I
MKEKIIPPQIKPKNDKGYHEIIRNGKKMNAIVSNAKVFNELVEKYGSFEKFLDSFREASYEDRLKTLSTQFKWLGRTGAHFFLWSIAEDAPPCEEIIA